jgi:photosystem II stability/assembly factor-like uncharacterized protein
VLAALGAAVWASFDGDGSSGVSLGRSASTSPSAAPAARGPARWRPLNGPQGGSIFALAVAQSDSRIVYATGWGIVFKSTDGGASWKDASAGEPWQENESLAIDPTHPNIVYVGTDRGIGKTVDGGRHWRMVNTGLFDRWPLPPLTANPSNGSAASLLAIDAQHPATVYATTGLGLYRTRNGGARWQIIGPLPFRNAIGRGPVRSSGYEMAFAIDPNHAETIYAGWSRYLNGTQTPSNLFKSSDGGDSWRRITTSTPLSLSALALTSSGALLATDQSRPGVFRSTDGGTTWSPAGLAGETIVALTSDPGSGAIYATTYDATNHSEAVFETTDGGETWQPASANFAWFGTVTDPNDPATVYATTNDGIVKSVDHGSNWAAADTGIVSMMIGPVALAPGRPATLYAVDGDSIFTSTDSARTWHEEAAGPDGTDVVTLTVSPRRPRTIFASTLGGLFESDDGGLRWSPIQTGYPGKLVRAVAIDLQHPSTIYIGACQSEYGECITSSPGGFRKTVDGGATWQPIAGVPLVTTVVRGGHVLHLTAAVQSLAIDPHRSNTVFAGTTRGGIFRSTDAGRSWQRVATEHGEPKREPGNAFPYSVLAIVVDPIHHDTVYAASSTGGVLKSTDGGTTWGTTNNGLTNPDMFALAVDPHKPRTLFASTYGGVFISTNGAASWHRDNGGLPAGGVGSFAIDPAGRTVYAGTNGDGVDALPLGG